MGIDRRDRRKMLVGLGGMVASGVAAALGVSIPYTQHLGVENIQRRRQRLLDALA